MSNHTKFSCLNKEISARGEFDLAIIEHATDDNAFGNMKEDALREKSIKTLAFGQVCIP